MTIGNGGPLAGIRVVDFSVAATGPYAAAMLADQGAEVVKVERPGIGDIGRWVGTMSGDVSALYQVCNRGKRGIVLDLQSPEGRDIAHRLIARSDLVVQNWRPGVAERLGLAYADVERPDLVYVAISGFGTKGPYSNKSAYDTVIQAFGGVLNNEADPQSGQPRAVSQVLADKVTALTAAQAMTAALLARERGRGGQYLELSMFDAVVSFMWIDCAGNLVLPDGDGSQPGSFAGAVSPLRFTDGWGVVTPTSDADFSGTCRAFGVNGYDDPRVATIDQRRQNRDVAAELMRACRDAAAGMTRAEGMERLEAQRVPCGVVLALSDLDTDPHAREVGMLTESSSARIGRVRQPRHPARFSATPSAPGGSAPGLGEHTDAILDEIGLGARAGELRRLGVVA